MKKLYTLLYVITSVIILSCSGNRYPQQLVLADSLSDKDPKKAITLLDSIKPQIKDAGKAVKNYYTLLRIKADDKKYVKHTSDTTILRLVDYYEHGGDRHLLPTAYYYAGRVYFDLNNYPEALKYFQNTINLLADDAPLKYKAYSQIGYIFLYQDLYDKGIEAFTEAYKYNKEKGNKSNQIYELCGIADCYKNKKDYSTALSHFKKALALSEQEKDKTMRHAIFAQFANIYYRQKKYVDAKKYIKLALKGVNDENRSSVYSIAADIYSKIGEQDSVLLLCTELYKMDNLYAKHFASKNLGHFFLNKNDAKKALFYLRQYETYSDSIQETTQTQTVAKVNALYNYQLKEKENDKLKIEIKEKRYNILLISLSAIVVIFLFISYYLYSNKKRHDERIRMERRMRLMQQKQEETGKAFIDENKRKIEELTAAIDGLKNENDKLKLELSEKREKLSNMNNMAEIRNKRQMLLENDIRNTYIYKKVWTILNNRTSDSKCKLSREDWDALDKEVNKHFVDFKKHISEVCKIDDHAYNICLLLKINIPPSGIATLTNKSDNAISSTRKRLCDRTFGGNNSPKDWDVFIRSL